MRSVSLDSSLTMAIHERQSQLGIYCSSVDVVGSRMSPSQKLLESTTVLLPDVSYSCCFSMCLCDDRVCVCVLLLTLNDPTKRRTCASVSASADETLTKASEQHHSFISTLCPSFVRHFQVLSTTWRPTQVRSDYFQAHAVFRCCLPPLLKGPPTSQQVILRTCSLLCAPRANRSAHHARLSRHNSIASETKSALTPGKHRQSWCNLTSPRHQHPSCSSSPPVLGVCDSHPDIDTASLSDMNHYLMSDNYIVTSTMIHRSSPAFNLVTPTTFGHVFVSR